eukprot:3771171-Amphidinium_carterae.1
MELASGRIVQLRCAQPHPVVIYTDASAEGWERRVGILIFVPGFTPVDSRADVSTTDIEKWSSRTQYIDQAELLVAPMVVVHYGHLLQNRDALWFFAMVKAGSPIEDNGRMSLRAAFRRTCFEHVPSVANP